MRKEFDELVAIMNGNELFQKNDEVDCALYNLEKKIDEVEKRMICAVLSAKEINETISKHTDKVDNDGFFKLNVNEHDLIQNCADDVRIALNLIEDMCIKDNWYNLFEPLGKPIVVGNVEYDFPEEVYTIGNADNTEIIGDVYESILIKLLEGKVIFTENDKGFTSGKANYVITHEQFIPLINFHQIDLSKVPIKREEFMSVESSHDDEDSNILDFDEATKLSNELKKYDAVKDIIAKLKEIEVDGETMEYILEQVGMKEQVLKQLFSKSTNDDIDYLHDVRNGND
jgi:hypothetical protein